MIKISKTKAIQLIDEKISQFEKAKYLPVPLSNPYYEKAFYGTLDLLSELFSKEEAKIFSEHITPSFNLIKQGDNLEGVALYFYRHLETCMSLLENYKEKIKYSQLQKKSKMWQHAKTVSKHKESLPFVSMSFNDADKEINEYVTQILRALQINFETGERYSRESIPQKVQNRIRRSSFFIVIFVKRDKIESGGYTTPSWLIKELGIAQGAKKDVIALVEREIKDIASLNYEKEVIYFDRNDIKEMQRATIKFLEALCEHELI